MLGLIQQYYELSYKLSLSYYSHDTIAHISYIYKVVPLIL